MKWESRSNQSLVTLLGVAAASALTMYMSDPDRGRRRRALAADKVRSVANKTGGAISVASRDLGNRAQGLRAQARNLFSRRVKSALIDDEVLTARVRKEIGRAVAHPRAVKVTAEQGCITLYGQVLESEKQQLLDCVRSVQGITEVRDNLEAHETAEHVPSLQGEGKRRQYGSLGVQGNWSPALRAIATVGGGALGYYGVVRRSPASMVAAMVGLGLIARSVSNRPFNELNLAGKRSQVIELHKSIHIAASPDKVFDVWSRLENFPQFMSNVQEVRDLGNGRSHWKVSGPAGIPVEWDAITTESVRPALLSWNSEPDSTIQHTGTVRLEPDGEGTRVTVHLSYSPPAGAVGHALASLFNDNPKQQMDQDLLRMKKFVESDMLPHDAARPIPTAQQQGSMLH